MILYLDYSNLSPKMMNHEQTNVYLVVVPSLVLQADHDVSENIGVRPKTFVHICPHESCRSYTYVVKYLRFSLVVTSILGGGGEPNEYLDISCGTRTSDPPG